MFGIRYVKVPPTTYILQYRSGKTVRTGAGLSFFYFAPNSDLVKVPLATADVPFVFNEVTADFQDATIQGELTYRVRDPKQLASLLDFSVDGHGRYRSSDPEKLNDRLIHAAQILARSFTQRQSLGNLLVSSATLMQEMTEGLKACETATVLGIEVLALSILSIKSTPEMAKALQADAREELLRKADEAVFVRRNAAVELERKIKENELNTEIAVEQKETPNPRSADGGRHRRRGAEKPVGGSSCRERQEGGRDARADVAGHAGAAKGRGLADAHGGLGRRDQREVAGGDGLS